MQQRKVTQARDLDVKYNNFKKVTRRGKFRDQNLRRLRVHFAVILKNVSSLSHT